MQKKNKTQNLKFMDWRCDLTQNGGRKLLSFFFYMAFLHIDIILASKFQDLNQNRINLGTQT